MGNFNANKPNSNNIQNGWNTNNGNNGNNNQNSWGNNQNNWANNQPNNINNKPNQNMWGPNTNSNNQNPNKGIQNPNQGYTGNQYGQTQQTWGQQIAKGSNAGIQQPYQQQFRGSGASDPLWAQQIQNYGPQLVGYGLQPQTANIALSNNLVWANGSNQALSWGVPGQRPGTPPTAAYTTGYNQVPVYKNPNGGYGYGYQ